MEDTSTYTDFIKVVQTAKESGVECIIVFKPHTAETDYGVAESPDMIVCTSNNPNIIAALLGNYPVAVEEVARWIGADSSGDGSRP